MRALIDVLATRATGAVLLSLALALLPAGSGLAQEEGEAEDSREARQEQQPANPADSQRPFLYLFPTAFQSGVDTSRVGDDSSSHAVTVFVPAVVSLRASDTRSRIYLIYEPQFEYFADDSSLNSWNHSGAVAFDYEIRPRLTLGAGGSVLRTADPTRAITELPLVLERGEYLSARGYVSLGYEINRSTVADLTVDHGYLRYDGLPGNDDVGIDTRGFGLITGVSHELNAAHTLAIRYSYVNEHALEDPEDLPRELAILLPLVPQHAVDVGWSFDAARGLTLSASLGAAYGDRMSWIGSAHLEKEWRRMRLLVGYQRLMGSYENFAPGGPGGRTDPTAFNRPLLPGRLGSTADVFGASLEGATGRIDVAARLQFALSSFAGEGPYPDGLAAGLGLRYQLTETIQPYIQAEYITQGLSPEVGIRRERGRYSAGLVFVLGPKPRNTSLRMEMERRRSLLPYAGARRPW